MKKLSGIIVALLLGIVMLFGVAGCGSGNQSELQGKIDELQSKIEKLEESLAEKDEKILELNEKIEMLEKQLNGKLSEGPFYSLQEAYYYGWLTKEDLMSIAYYHGGRRLNEGLMSEDYTPAPKTPEVLSEETQLKIKIAAAKDFNEEHNRDYAEADGFTITKYYGTYGNCIAIDMRDNYSGMPGIIWVETIAGINFEFNGREMRIWREV